MKTNQPKILSNPRENFRKAFYDRIKKGIGLTEVAASLDKPYNSIQRWGIADKGLPDAHEIALICAATGYHPDWLILGHGSPNFTENELALIAAMRSLDDRQKAAVNAQLEAFGVSKKKVEEFLELAAPMPFEARPIFKNKSKMNTRADYPTFHAISPKIATIRPIPLFWGLAAGAGRELERCSDICAFRERLPYGNVHAATVTGVSMMDTVRHGETILVQAFDGDGMVLPSLESDDDTTPFEIVRRFVRDQDICILSINDEEPTLKRCNIFMRKTRWNLTITADNPTPNYPRPISKDDKVTFYATMVGYVKREND